VARVPTVRDRERKTAGKGSSRTSVSTRDREMRKGELSSAAAGRRFRRVSEPANRERDDY